MQILEIINLWMKVFTLLPLVKEKKSLEMISLGVFCVWRIQPNRFGSTISRHFKPKLIFSKQVNRLPSVYCTSIINLFIIQRCPSVYKYCFYLSTHQIHWKMITWSNFTWHFHLIEFFGQTPKFKVFDRIIRSTAKKEPTDFGSWSKFLIMVF